MWTGPGLLPGSWPEEEAWGAAASRELGTKENTDGLWPPPCTPHPRVSQTGKTQEGKISFNYRGTRLCKWKYPQPVEDGRVGQGGTSRARANAGLLPARSRSQADGPCGSITPGGWGPQEVGLPGLPARWGPALAFTLRYWMSLEQLSSGRPAAHPGQEVEERAHGAAGWCRPSHNSPGTCGERGRGGVLGPPGHFHPSQPAGPAYSCPGKSHVHKTASSNPPPSTVPSRDELTPPGAPSTTRGLRHSHLSNFSLLFVFPAGSRGQSHR